MPCLVAMRWGTTMIINTHKSAMFLICEYSIVQLNSRPMAARPSRRYNILQLLCLVSNLGMKVKNSIIFCECVHFCCPAATCTCAVATLY